MGYMDVSDHAIIIDATMESKQNRNDWCAYDFCRGMQPSEAMARRRGPIDRALGMGGGSCGRLPLSTRGRDKSGPYLSLQYSKKCYNTLKMVPIGNTVTSKPRTIH